MTKEEQKILFRNVIQIADYDRERISKNIHDEIGTILSIIKLNLSKISRHLNNTTQSEILLKESMNLLDSTLQSTRNISSDLASPTLSKLGYENGIAELCRKVSNSGKIKVVAKQSENEVRLPSFIELQAYRLMKEILNNIIKHSKATEIRVSMKSDKNGVITEIVYNGINMTLDSLTNLFQTELKYFDLRLELIKASVDYGVNEHGESVITLNISTHER